MPTRLGDSSFWNWPSTTNKDNHRTRYVASYILAILASKPPCFQHNHDRGGIRLCAGRHGEHLKLDLSARIEMQGNERCAHQSFPSFIMLNLEIGHATYPIPPSQIPADLCITHQKENLARTTNQFSHKRFHTSLSNPHPTAPTATPYPSARLSPSSLPAL